MSPSKAILVGSVVIAVSIAVSTALFLSVPREKAERLAAQGPSAPGAMTDRYQIVKVENGASWRLDRETGELTFCRIEAGRMICTKSTDAVEAPPRSAEELQAQREAEAKRDERGDAIFDRFMALFDRVLKMIEQDLMGRRAPEPAPSQRMRSL